MADAVEDSHLIGGWIGDIRGSHVGNAYMLIEVALV